MCQSCALHPLNKIYGAMKQDPQDLDNTAVRENVRLHVRALENLTPTLRKLVKNHLLRFVGAV